MIIQQKAPFLILRFTAVLYYFDLSSLRETIIFNLLIFGSLVSSLPLTPYQHISYAKTHRKQTRLQCKGRSFPNHLRKLLANIWHLCGSNCDKCQESLLQTGACLSGFFLKRLTGAVVYTLILRGIPIIFHTYKKTYSELFAHWTRQGLKLLILTFKRSQLVVVGYYRTTGEFFLVSANSSTILLYNTRLGRAGGKENGLFLQVESTSFHNETISIRQGPFADSTINYHILQRSIISEAMEERKKKWWSQEEKRLCASPCLWEHFPPSASDAASARGSPNAESAASAHSLVKALRDSEKASRGTRPKPVHDPCLEHPSGTCHLGEIKPCPFLFLF